ncbi:MAG: polysaccharide deacetylase family protein, partial [Chloroflexi bacterium]|nr:polysaccharide deacetylase family protein [Chloroflexota bacterium]
EIAHHGYTHRWPDSLSSEVQRAEFAKGYDLIAELTGTPPKGLRAPVMELTPTLLEELVRRDMLYSSNMMDDDRPYRHVVDGIKTGVVELPSCWLLDDAPFFLYSVRIPGRVMQSPDTVYQMWVAELEGLYAEPDTCFVIAFHPQVIGRPSRLAMLERFTEYAKAKPGAWLGRCDEIASDLRDRL